MTTRLSSIDGLPATVARPAYDREGLGAGIVHLGLGAFHKAHQAHFTEDALNAAGGDWRIIGVSLRSTAAHRELAPQNGLYTLIERDAAGSRARVIGALSAALPLTTHRADVLNALCAPSTRIVTITVTEKGYGVDRATGAVDLSHEAIAADLAAPGEPTGLAGLLVWALGQRRAAGTPPFTVVSCDNLPDNGHVVQSLLTDFAARTAPSLVEHIASEVAFPSSMVDRITPAQTPDTLALAQSLIGQRDDAAVETEAFRQWVIEDHFPTGRPAWDAGGAIFTSSVRPYEDMKLRMLNGTHSMLAYTGFLCGHKTVFSVMQDDALVALIRRHFAAAAGTLAPVAGISFDQYARDLEARFANPNLAHETYQIAMDGSQKMPQRIFAPAEQAVREGRAIDAFAFATASWLRYTVGRREDGHTYALRDPLQAALKAGESAQDITRNLHSIETLLPPALAQSAVWESAVTDRLSLMLSSGMRAAIDREVAAMGTSAP